MSNRLYRFAENFIFHTHGWHWLLAFLLFPLSLAYCFVCIFRKLISFERDFGIPIISVGNLTVGGSGKTPVTIALAKLLDRPAVVLRGYGRKSIGLVVVSDGNKILTTVDSSGDEAMEYATSISTAVVIVSEDRALGIQKAKELGAQTVLLDDGFGKFNIKKYDILLELAQPPVNPFCLPAGPYKCPFFMRNFADLIFRENVHFRRSVEVVSATDKMLLVTAISNPSRLEPFLPDRVVDRLYFKDHDYFDEVVMGAAVKKSGANSLLVTGKDAVKLTNYSGKLSIMKLNIEFDLATVKTIESLDGIKLAPFESER